MNDMRTIGNEVMQMKAMSKEDLIRMLELTCVNILFEDDIQHLFERLGDEYYYDRERAAFTLSKVNENREKFLGRMEGWSVEKL